MTKKVALIITGNYICDIFIEKLIKNFLHVNKDLEFDIILLQWNDNNLYIDDLTNNSNKFIYKHINYNDFLCENAELINYYKNKKGFRLSMLIQCFQWKKALEFIDIDKYQFVIRMRDDLIFIKETKIDNSILENIKKNILYFPNKNSFIDNPRLPGGDNTEDGICDFMAMSSANSMKIYLNFFNHWERKKVISNYINAEIHFEHNLIKYLRHNEVIRNAHDFNCSLKRFLR